MNSLHLYQIAIIFIAAVMIFQGAMNFVRGKNNQTILKLLIRIIVWGGMAVVAIYPDLTNTVAELIGMQGNINAVILTGFILVFLMIFKLLSAIERLEQQMTELTRKDALGEMKNEK
ncbi:MAG: hypothetical protein A2259_02670 [Candidatus Moranbacteria bacterium RIFOXYA2_FULL_43_15]|nr:MAG: hypothetical protein A2259_02670 [Candidatus Moranbacteria bacterium RIFOXYA2_FULL_43_15]